MSRGIETSEFQVPPDGNPDGKNRERRKEKRNKGRTVEINGFSRPRWGESNLRTPLSSGGSSTKKRKGIPRRPIDLLAGNVSIEPGDIFVNRAHLALSDLIPRVELRSSVTLPFEAIEPWCHAEHLSTRARYFVTTISLKASGAWTEEFSFQSDSFVWIESIRRMEEWGNVVKVKWKKKRENGKLSRDPFPRSVNLLRSLTYSNKFQGIINPSRPPYSEMFI